MTSFIYASQQLICINDGNSEIFGKSTDISMARIATNTWKAPRGEGWRRRQEYHFGVNHLERSGLCPLDQRSSTLHLFQLKVYRQHSGARRALASTVSQGVANLAYTTLTNQRFCNSHTFHNTAPQRHNGRTDRNPQNSIES